MKKFITLLAVLCASCACNQIEQNTERLDNTVTEYSAIERLKADLLEYNASYPVIPDTKSWSQFWKRIKITVAADMSGAFWGGILTSFTLPGVVVFTGVISSLYSATLPVDYYIPTPMYESIYDSPMIMNSIDSVGYMHNQLICDIYNQSPAQYPNYTLSQCYMLLMQQMPPHYNLSSNNLDRVQVQLIVERVCDIVQSAESVDDVIQGLRRYTNGYDDEIDVIQTYMNGICQIGDNMIQQRQYTRGFLDNIRYSNIEVNQKNHLLSTIGVAGHSMILWTESTQ